MMDNNNHYYTECTYEHICKVKEGVTSIEDWGLADEIELTKIVFPSTLTELGDLCCLGLENLVEVEFNMECSLEVIPRSCFAQCASLKQIVLPPSVKAIEEDAFGESGIKNVVITSEEMPTIDESAFQDCSIVVVFNAVTKERTVFNSSQS